MGSTEVFLAKARLFLGDCQMRWISSWFVNLYFNARGTDQAYGRVRCHFKVLVVLLGAVVTARLAYGR